MGKFIDLTGQRFGRLVVVNRVENTKNGHAKWHCVCDCGNEVDVSQSCLRNGDTQSCGCLQKERISEFNLKNKKKLNEYEYVDNYIIARTNNGVEFYIDKDDEWVLKDYCWHTDRSGYLCTDKRYSRERIKLHRLIMNCPDNMVVDHINGNTFDNRKYNLRIVTKSQNNMNHKVNSNNTSGTTGVSFHRRENKWKASISFNNKRICLGTFDNFSDAVSARKSAEEKYFGEYSYDNSRNKTTTEINSDRVVETCEAHDHLIYA